MLRRVPSLVQILFVEFIAILLLASVSAKIIAHHGALGCGSTRASFSLTDAGATLLGLLGTSWLLWRMFWPKVVTDAFRPTLKISGWILYNPNIPSVSYEFCSTHPSYALMELTSLVPLWILYRFGELPPAYAGCDAVFSYFFGRIALGLVLLFPFLRIMAWYVFRRKLPKIVSQAAWKPVVFFLAIAVPVYVAIPLTVYVPLWRAPLVDTTTFAGGLPAHNELRGKTVKLQGVLKHPGAQLCTCTLTTPPGCRVAAILVDLGSGGDVVAHGVSSNADTIRALVDSPEAKAGKPIHLYGVLNPLPKPPNGKPAYEPIDCGWADFGPPPPAGRAYLQVEMP